MPEPAILKPKPLWTGKQILSLIFPKVNFRKGNDKSKGMDCEKDLNVLVKNGELICGMMNKGVVGASQGGLIHIIWRDCGPFATRDFMSQVQNIVNNWLSTNGFTIGVQDIIANQSTLDKIQGELIEHKQAVQEIIKSARAGKLEKVTGMGMLDSFEFRVNQKLKQALDVSGRLALADLAPYNRLKNMVTAGSKGGEFNISQIMACVGQQNVTGKRIPFGFNRRSLPHFSKDDFGPESKGFVFSSYFLGLTPQEFYFHAMGGREGLIDTAVKTADTGYIQRRLIKALEDVQVKYDQTVRTSRDQIIQFLYGEDGMAGELIENQNLPLLDWNNKELEKKYQFFPQNADDKEKKHIMDQFIETATPEDNQEDLSNQLARISEALDQEYAQIYKDRGVLRSVIKGDLPDDKVWLPVNLNRLLWNAREKYDIKVGQKTNLTPEYIIDRVKWLTDSAIQVYRESRMKNPIIRTANDDATLLIKIFLRHKLASKVLIQDNKTRQSQESFEWLIGEIEDRFRNSMVHPGEMVGSIGAQSLGEPATQMTLNTFHSAGVGAKNVTLGVPRLREVINVATTLKTPSLKIQLKDPYKKDEKVVSQVGNEITTVTLLDVVTSTSVYYDPDPTKTIIKADEALVRNFEQNNFLDENELAGLSSWILRIEIDTQKLQGKYLSLEKIEQVLRDRIPSLESCSLNIIRNIDAENLERAVIRLRLPEELIEADEMQTTPQKLGEMEKVLVNEMTLRGIPMITKFTYYKMMTQNSCFYDEETGDQIKRKNDFCIETDGVNLKQVLNVDRIEYQTVMSNSIREILTVLGVEATRKSILSELRFVLGAYGIYVNYRHLGTLCDIMTNRGVLTAITRHGINRIDSGALRKCSFEETVEILLEASFHAELDPLSGVTENIIMGQLAPYGTGSFDIMMDTDMIQKVSADHKEATDIVPDIPQDFEKVFDEGGMTPIVASPNMQDVGDGMSTYGQSDYGGFTPIASDSGGQSLYFANSPGQPMMACPQSPSAARPPAAYGQTPGGPMMGGAYAGAGGGSPSYGYGGQSPATQGYGMAYASQSPAYQGQRGPAQGMQFGNQGMSPRYAMSPSRPMGGGTTPGYSGGYMPQASMSPAYMQSPGYSPTGNPAMSPTAYVTPDEPVYGKKEESKKN